MRVPPLRPKLVLAGCGLLLVAVAAAGCGHDVVTDGKLGSACITPSDCRALPPDQAMCFSSAPDGYCSMTCGTGLAGCPDGSNCYGFPVSPPSFVCLKTCTSDRDCAAGLTCRLEHKAKSGDPKLCLWEAFDAEF